MITYTPAVLVTGSDNRGNEFCYFKSMNGWVDSYNEKQVKDDFIRHYVFPIVQKVYFSDLIMTGAEWAANGCPMELTEEQMHAIEEASALDVLPLAEQVKIEIEGNADWLDSDMVAESHTNADGRNELEDEQLRAHYGKTKVHTTASWRERHLHQTAEEMEIAKANAEILRSLR